MEGDQPQARIPAIRPPLHRHLLPREDEQLRPGDQAVEGAPGPHVVPLRGRGAHHVVPLNGEDAAQDEGQTPRGARHSLLFPS